MRNPVDKIKQQIFDVRNRRGMRDMIAVEAKSLLWLIDMFEKFDYEERVKHESFRGQELSKQLHDLIIANYHQNEKDPELTLALIMDTLRPLIEESHKNRKVKLEFFS